MSMADSYSDALRDALSGLADALDPLLGTSVDVGGSVENAQTQLENAASSIDALAVSQILANNPALAQLQTLTGEISTKANQIASQEKSTARIVGIAAGAVTLAQALQGGSIPAIVKAASDIQSIID